MINKKIDTTKVLYKIRDIEAQIKKLQEELDYYKSVQELINEHNFKINREYMNSVNKEVCNG